MADAPPTSTERAEPNRPDAAALKRLWRPFESPEPPPEAPWLHQEVARRMAERLSLIRRQPAVVLDWAAPRGGSDAIWSAQAPATQVLRTDLQGRMLAESAGTPTSWWRRVMSPGKAATRPDAERPRAHLLWANMLLHQTDDVPALLAQWHDAIEVDGFLMFSCLGPDTLRELHAVHDAAGYGPAGLRGTDLHDIGDALVQAGFADPVMDMERLTLTWADAESMLRELRGLGRNLSPSRHAGLRTPSWRASWLAKLVQALRGADGRLHLSFEVIYGHAFRVAARAKVSAHTEISLDSMREMTRRKADR